MSGVVLLSCPFCGGTSARMSPPTCNRNTVYNAADRAFPVVRCGCHVEVWGKDWDESGESAIAAWNTRAPAEVSEAEIERASAAVVADGETVFWSIVFGLNADTNEVRKSMVREILRTAIAAARKVHP